MINLLSFIALIVALLYFFFKPLITQQLRNIFMVWLIGLIGLFIGILSTVLSIQNAFYEINQTGNIEASAMANSIVLAYKSTIYGLGFFIISLIMWGALKIQKNNKSNIELIDK